jgi:ribosomal protein S18 acetylase RimI-like enzyme
MSTPKGARAFAIRPMKLADHGAVHRIWRKAKGICVVEDDSRSGIHLYLSRNPGLCFVATVDERIVGTVLCGHDGRRAILRHLAVIPEFRKQGIGSSLVDRCLRALARQRISKCNIFVMDGNIPGMRFWRRLGYRLLADEYRTLQIGTHR